MSDSMKVFLSHKGLDKALVTDFKQTLQQLGYATWIDEDAMPAGTVLERGLLNGMQDSCGAVFFITPSFGDEGYLATEVEYAIRQKRQKGDKFAIVTLQFEDEDGKVGTIPELLKGYVWKTPKTHLEALREIIRALPVKVSNVSWREGIENVSQLPEVKSQAEVPNEAKEVLVRAAEVLAERYKSIAVTAAMKYRGGVGELPHAGVPPLPPLPYPSEKRYNLRNQAFQLYSGGISSDEP